MSFTDTLKRSLGFEETESNDNKSGEGFSLTEFINSFTKSSNNDVQQPNPTNAPNTSAVNETPVYESYEYDVEVITPDQPFYEVVLIRPKSLDDINYVVDQIIEEKNPVILDLSFLEKESPANFKLAGDKIKQLRANYDAQALLLARSEDKNLIILSPSKVKVINKG